MAGRVSDSAGNPIASCFVGALSTSWELERFAHTDASGKFDLDFSEVEGYLVLQPQAIENRNGLGIYGHMPRVYRWQGESNLDFRLPAGGCIVVRAHGDDGELMRWQDFQERGTFAGQFLYITNLEHEMVPVSIWPVHDAISREAGAPREKGIPAAVIPEGEKVVVHVLFWDVPEAGRLHLCADNAGEGFVVRDGEAIEIDLEVELARTAVASFERRPLSEVAGNSILVAAMWQRLGEIEAEHDPATRATRANALLGQVLLKRNEFELALARNRIAAIEMDVRPFRFGVFEGSPYNPGAWTLARESGFTLATVMLGWDWTQRADGTSDWEGLDRVFGISSLDQRGYSVKAHGVVYLQEYGILPERAKSMRYEQLKSELIAHERSLIEHFGNLIVVWEAMNEPGHTNVLNFSRDNVIDLLAASAAAIKERPGLTSLVNSAHESDYGAKFAIYGVDNVPENDFRITYSDFLGRADAADALDRVDVIGLQFYPGFHFNEMFGGQEGPAVPPYWIVETAERYHARFGKPIHVTEFSLPSTYGGDWKSGYWKAKWTEAGQAEYAEQVFLLAYGCPAIESITWWDITDAKPSVISGGLATAAGKPKPALTRLKAFIDSVQSRPASR